VRYPLGYRVPSSYRFYAGLYFVIWWWSTIYLQVWYSLRVPLVQYAHLSYIMNKDIEMRIIRNSELSPHLCTVRRVKTLGFGFGFDFSIFVKTHTMTRLMFMPLVTSHYSTRFVAYSLLSVKSSDSERRYRISISLIQPVV
jgi:hypothetical protein